MPIYLDNHATTRVDPRVLEAMLPYFSEEYGNAGSVSHAYGHRAAEAVEAARATIAAEIGALPREIVFTSGATESNNLALRGVAERQRRKGNHFVSVTTEHKAVLDPLARLARRGCEVTLLEVTPADERRAGLIDPQQVADALREETLLVSVMLANNEIGALQPIAEIGAICKARGVLLHCDATQGVGRLPVDVERLGVDLLSFSGHKLYGPKGIGALYVRHKQPAVRLEPQIAGGGHERGMRSGTLNVPGIVGLAAALRLCSAEMESEAARQRALRDRLYGALGDTIDDVLLNGPALDLPDGRLAGNLNVSFRGVDGEALTLKLPELAVSTGAACTSADPEPSHVVRALGCSDERTRASLRFGLGRFNTAEEIERAAELVAGAVRELRQLGSLAG